MSSITRGGRAVVTGGGSGLGREICLELARRGCRILVADIQGDRADSVCQEAMKLGAQSAVSFVADVSRIEDVERMATEAERVFGGVDLVVNNAGVAIGGQVGEQKLSDWNWIMGINLMGVVHGCHVFVPKLRKQRSGHVLNIASAAGLLSPPTLAAYSVTKAGVVSLSEALYSELAGSGVGVTVVCPTFFKTRLIENARFSDPSLKHFGNDLFEKARTTAAGVAKAALDGVDHSRLYVLPSADARFLWLFKRLLPRFFAAAVPAVQKLRMRKVDGVLPARETK